MYPLSLQVHLQPPVPRLQERLRRDLAPGLTSTHVTRETQATSHSWVMVPT